MNLLEKLGFGSAAEVQRLLSARSSTKESVPVPQQTKPAVAADPPKRKGRPPKARHAENGHVEPAASEETPPVKKTVRSRTPRPDRQQLGERLGREAKVNEGDRIRVIVAGRGHIPISKMEDRKAIAYLSEGTYLLLAAKDGYGNIWLISEKSPERNSVGRNAARPSQDGFFI